MSHDFPTDLRYTKDHEWARKDGKEILVGVSGFAVVSFDETSKLVTSLRLLWE